MAGGSGGDRGQHEEQRQYLHCSGFKVVELITEGPDSNSVFVVERKGQMTEARVYLASMPLNPPQGAVQFLNDLP